MVVSWQVHFESSHKCEVDLSEIWEAIRSLILRMDVPCASAVSKIHNKMHAWGIYDACVYIFA